MKKYYSLILLLFLAGNIFATGNRDKQHPALNSLRGNGLRFTQNKGQIADMDGKLCPDVLYNGDGAGADVYLRKTGISYVYNNRSEVMRKVNEQTEELEKQGKISEQEEEKRKQELFQKQILKLHRVDMDFVNCNSNIQTVNEDEVEGNLNFYYAHCPAGITNVKQYNKITYKNIYNNIDVCYYGNSEHGVKYDIIIQPHTDPGQIKLHWTGAENIQIDHAGRLMIKTSVNDFYESMPKVYQNINGQIVDVKAEYHLASLFYGERRESEALVTFKLSAYDPNYPLIIDPWLSYYGGSGDDKGSSVTMDPSGNPIFTGYTSSNLFPLSAGAIQTAYAGKDDAFIVKMNANGTRNWATYYGGAGEDHGQGIICDLAGTISVAGYTKSTNFPVGASGGNVVQQNSSGGTTDAFLLVLDGNGIRIWATYYGGSNVDFGYDVATDGSNIYLYGVTSSTNAISTIGSFQAALKGTTDVFIAKFASNGAIAWGTYLGGTSSNEECTGGITYDPVSKNIYLAGYTQAADFPVLAGDQMVYGGSVRDAFLCKFDLTGKMLWGTYHGGTGSDYGSSVVTDGLGNVYLGGYTGSLDGISTPGSFQPAYGGGGGFGSDWSDGFLAKYNSNGILQWATYLGGSTIEGIWSLAAGSDNNIYVYGDIEDFGAGNYPVSSCAYQTTFLGGSLGPPFDEDQFLAKYDPTGKQVCITYVGGTGEEDPGDEVHGVRAIANYKNFLYITGWSRQGGYPVTPGAFQTTFAGGNAYIGDAYIDQFCINLCEAKTPGLNYTASTTSVCNNTPVTFTPSVNNSCDTSGYIFQWTFTGGNPPTSTAVNPTVTYPAPGNYNVKLTLITSCKKDSLTKTNYIVVNPCGTLSASTTKTDELCNGDKTGKAIVTAFSGKTPYTYSWSNGVTNATNASSDTITGLSAKAYTVTITDGSGSTVSTVVTIGQPTPIVTSAPAVTDAHCGSSDGSANVTTPTGGTSPYTYSWNNNQTTQNLSAVGAGDYTLTVSDSKNCTATITAHINNITPAATLLSHTDASCNGTNDGSATLNAPVGGTSPYTYSWSNGVTQTTISASGLAANTYTVTVKDAGNCISTVSVKITEPSPIVTNTPAVSNAHCGAGDGSATVTTPTGGTSPYTYSWDNNQTSQNLNAVAAGSYILTVKDSKNCTTSVAAIVNSIGGATITLQSQTAATCNGSGDGTAVLNAPTGGTAPFIYSWSNGFTSTALTISGLSAKDYTVTIKDANNCQSTLSITITQPTAVGGSTTSTTVSCAGQPDGTATVSGNGGTPTYTYTWDNNKTGSTVSGLANGNYTVTIKDLNNCSATKTVSVGLPVPIAPTTISTNAACNGINNGTATAGASGGTTPYSYWWNNGQTVSSASALASGTYTVTVTDKNNCSATKTVAVGITGGPTAVATGDATITQGTSVQLNATGGTSYLWTPPTNLSCTACQNPIAAPKISTWYLVNVTDINGCSAKDSVFIEVDLPCGELFIPTAFSPNNDGVNDKFCIRGKCINNYLLQIFDRWGEMIFESTNIANCWDGTFNGKPLNTAVFVFQLKGINSATNEKIDQKGNVTLVR